VSNSWRQALACTCGEIGCSCGSTVARQPQRDRLQLVATEVPPKKAAHQKMLRRHAKLNTFVRCPACRQRGGMYYLHSPSEAETRWCYQCGYKG